LDGFPWCLRLCFEACAACLSQVAERASGLDCSGPEVPSELSVLIGESVRLAFQPEESGHAHKEIRRAATPVTCLADAVVRLALCREDYWRVISERTTGLRPRSWGAFALGSAGGGGARGDTTFAVGAQPDRLRLRRRNAGAFRLHRDLWREVMRRAWRCPLASWLSVASCARNPRRAAPGRRQ
jgi:hypothetical protein